MVLRFNVDFQNVRSDNINFSDHILTAPRRG
jgi:hypothetical protein